MRITKYRTELDEDNKNILVRESVNNYPEITGLDMPYKIAEALNRIFRADRQAEEHLWLITMDTKCKPIGFFEVSHGTVTTSLVGTREILVRCLLCGASAFIIAHNHPSGDNRPSEEDITVTRKVKEAADLIGIRMLDHVIVGSGCHYSFKESGMV